jgi:type I restriction enzyme S subunit
VSTDGRWRPYPSYKDSGVEWLGKIPTHWQTKQVKRVFNIVNGSTPRSNEADYWNGDIPWVTPNDLGRLSGDTIYSTERSITRKGYQSCGTTLVPAGSLVLSTRAPIGHLAIAGMDLCTNQGCRALVFRSRENSQYFYYQLLAARPELESFGRGSTFLELGRDELGTVSLAYSSSSEQCAIAAFLDRETAKIDALVAKQERLIELLQEKRAALISHAVTKGLDPDVPMKDSGIPSIGQIPAHWEVKRNKRIFEERNERSLTGEEELLSVSHITGVTPRSEKEVYMFMAESMEGYKLCHPGDLVINTMWAWMGALGITEYEGIVSPSYHVYKLTKEYAFQYVPKYLDLLYRTPAYVCEITRHSKGVWTSRLRLYPDSFFDMYTPTPPLAEQRQILAHITEQLQQMAALIDKSHRFIERLQEYRTALISAAVTGKIDVRNEVRRTSTQPGVALRHP